MKGTEGIAPAVYLAHDAGIWRHVSDLFDPKWFQLLQKGNGANSIQTVEQWGKWLADSKNYGSYQGQNAGRVVFEKLASEGHAPNLPGGGLSSSGTDQFVDYMTKTGERIQLKHSLGKYVPQDLLNGKYSPANGVDGVAVNSETYKQIISAPAKYGFQETATGSGIAIDPDTGTRLMDSGLDSTTSRDILLKAQNHARDNLEAFDLTEHLAVNSLKAAAIGAIIAFALRGSINLYKYSKGVIRGDDAVDNTVSCTIRAAMTGGVTTFIAGGTMAAIGIPTAGLGLIVAIPVGVGTGLVVSKVVNETCDAIYENLMGGEYIALARSQNAVLAQLFDTLDEQFVIANKRQQLLEAVAKEVPVADVEAMEATLASAKEQIRRTSAFLPE